MYTNEQKKSNNTYVNEDNSMLRLLTVVLTCIGLIGFAGFMHTLVMLVSMW